MSHFSPLCQLPIAHRDLSQNRPVQLVPCFAGVHHIYWQITVQYSLHPFICNNFRQLGLGNAVRETPGSSFGTADERVQILLDEVDCTGNEYYLSDCPNLGWNTHDCRHHEDAGVVCQGPDQGMLSTCIQIPPCWLCRSHIMPVPLWLLLFGVHLMVLCSFFMRGSSCHSSCRVHSKGTPTYSSHSGAALYKTYAVKIFFCPSKNNFKCVWIIPNLMILAQKWQIFVHILYCFTPKIFSCTPPSPKFWCLCRLLPLDLWSQSEESWCVWQNKLWPEYSTENEIYEILASHWLSYSWLKALWTSSGVLLSFVE